MTKRPFLLLLVAFAAAVTAAELFLPGARTVLLCAAGGCVLALVFFLFSRFCPKARPTLALFALLALSASAGLFSHFSVLDRAEARLLAAPHATLDVTVVDAGEYTSYGVTLTAKVNRLDGSRCGGCVRIATDGTTPYPLGTRLFVTGAVAAPDETTSGGFPERRWLRSLGVLATVTPDEGGVTVTGDAKTPAVLAAKLRAAVTARVEHAAAYRDGGLCAALLTGMRDGIDPHFTLSLRRAGVSHLFAISGMHFSMLLGAVDALLFRLKRKKRTRILVSVCVGAFYCAVAGFAASVLRAGLMLGAVALGYLLGRERDGFTALAAAVALILLFEPWAASGCALWLSAAATAGLLGFAPLSARVTSAASDAPKPVQVLVGRVALPVGLALAAGLFTMPLSALYFGQVSLAAPLATLAATPFVAVLLGCAILFALVGVPMPIVTAVAAWTAQALDALLGAVSKLGFIVLPLGDAVPALCALAASGAVALWLFKSRKHERLAAILCAFAVCAAPVGAAVARLTEPRALHVGVASFHRSDLVVFRAGGAVVFDLSNGYSRANTAVQNLCDALGRTEIETLVITRLDHAAVRSIREMGCDAVIREILLPPAADEAERANAAMCRDAAALCGATVGEYEYGVPFVRGDVRYTCYAPRYLERSAVPVRCFVAEGETKVCYLGSGMAELPADAFAEARAGADLLLSGAAGPIERIPFETDEAPMLSCAALGERGTVVDVKKPSER